MSALFETAGLVTKRKATGSSFRVNHIPLELSSFNCFYENPIHGVDLGILMVFISETFVIENQNGVLINQPACTAVILEKGRIKKDLLQKIGSSAAAAAVDDMITDIYELMAALLEDHFPRYGKLLASEIRPHVYETETRQFNEAMWNTPDHVRLGPEAISKLQATLVF